MNTWQEIIGFWFGDLAPSVPNKGRFEMWFGKDSQTDRQIVERFRKHIGPAGSGAFDDWQEGPESCLALIVLLDQFPRNTFRNSPKAFDYDPKAREVSRNGMSRKHDRKLPLFGRLFFYMPFQHSEHLNDQEKSLQLYGSLLEEAAPELKQTFEMVMDYARRHHEIIARFNRFPHRNDILGRESTPEEVEFLKGPGSSF